MPALARLLARALVVAGLLSVVALIAHHDPSPRVTVAGTPIARPTTTSTSTTVAPATTEPATIAEPVVIERSTTTVASAPAPVPVSDVEQAIAAHFGDIYSQAYGVARCESTLDPNAVSKDGANWGLFQINRVHRARVEAMGYSWAQILEPYVNAAVARSIYDEQGWAPWSCRWAAG